jgi:hypothetical protein
MVKLIFKQTFVLLSIVVSLSVQSCVSHDIEAQEPKLCTSSDIISFKDQIKPIINTKCAIDGVSDDCHDGANGADINWTVLGNFQNHSHEVKRRINLPASDDDHMPREGELSSEQIQLITCWVEQGAKDN